jgi:ABC-type transport system substrate-binding protein
MSAFRFLRQPRFFWCNAPSTAVLALVFPLLLSACGETWNNPYPAAESGANVMYTAFSERPKHLDPAQSYTEDEITFLAQIYEPPLQYHYLKRPYELVPATAQAVPQPRLFDAQGKPLPAHAPAGQVAESVYDIHIRPGIRYQPHPAFAVDAQGRPRYADLTPDQLRGINGIPDFAEHATRELTADDYIYQIKRLAHPKVHSPIFGMMAERIVGLRELGEALSAAAKAKPDAWLDLDRFPLAGVERVDRYTYRVHIRGKYPQFLYWLAMHFFAPMPREADRFYSQPGMAEKNLTLDWWPVGTGPFYLAENDPNRRMVLRRNPNFRGETYPCEGEVGDREAGLLADCGKPLPQLDAAVFTREKESIPYWNKFLQGYYDASGIASDNFDQAVRVGGTGDIALTEEMQAKGIRLLSGVRASTYYLGFNMIDSVVGGQGGGPRAAERGRKLRQAIAIALNEEEFISIFLNGRGVPAQGALPPGIFGFEDGRAGINPVVYRWVGDDKTGHAERRSLEEAKQLLAEAGWPHGRDAQTGEPLVLNLDTTSGGMGEKSKLDWLTRQFSQLGIQLVVRATDWNRFQEKLRKASTQLFFLGWNADYPDPENFFFLLHGKEARVPHGGENSANYSNPEFDRLFLQMKDMDNGPERLAIIRQMQTLLRQDSPWLFGFHPVSYTLGHRWLHNRKPMEVGNSSLKYQRIDVAERNHWRREWNAPVRAPLFVLLAATVLSLWLGVRSWRRREQKGAVT